MSGADRDQHEVGRALATPPSYQKAASTAAPSAILRVLLWNDKACNVEASARVSARGAAVSRQRSGFPADPNACSKTRTQQGRPPDAERATLLSIVGLVRVAAAVIGWNTRSSPLDGAVVK
jgi:hypothetical protein